MTDMTQIEITGYHGSSVISLEARMIRNHQVFLQGMIDSSSADVLVQQLMYIDGDASAAPVRLYINSPGGEVTSGLLIYDVLQMMKKPVDLYCMGMAASMAAVILASGKKGHRHILPHSKTMIHEPLITGGPGGSATSIQRLSQSIMDTRRVINELLSRHTGKTLEEINKATSFDNYMNAEERIRFGLCDDITRIFG